MVHITDQPDIAVGRMPLCVSHNRPATNHSINHHILRNSSATHAHFRDNKNSFLRLHSPNTNNLMTDSCNLSLYFPQANIMLLNKSYHFSSDSHFGHNKCCSSVCRISTKSACGMSIDSSGMRTDSVWDDRVLIVFVDWY